MMVSRQRRAGAPLLFAFGAQVMEGRVRVPLLIYSAQLDPITYDLFDPDNPEEVVRVRLPEVLIDHFEDAHRLNVTLEVA
jgi:hypothetical protein